MQTEAASYLERIEDLRSQVVNLIAGLSAEALNWRPVETQDDHITNSLAVMAGHIAGAEHFWIQEVIGRRPATRIRENEFFLEVQDPQPLIAALNSNKTTTQKLFATLSASDLQDSRQVGERVVPVRWAILHVIDHTALHLGHMQITYQLWRGGQATKAARWFERFDQQHPSS